MNLLLTIKNFLSRVLCSRRVLDEVKDVLDECEDVVEVIIDVAIEEIKK